MDAIVFNRRRSERTKVTRTADPKAGGAPLKRARNERQRKNYQRPQAQGATAAGARSAAVTKFRATVIRIRSADALTGQDACQLPPTPGSDGQVSYQGGERDDHAKLGWAVECRGASTHALLAR